MCILFGCMDTWGFYFLALRVIWVWGFGVLGFSVGLGVQGSFFNTLKTLNPIIITYPNPNLGSRDLRKPSTLNPRNKSGLGRGQDPVRLSD